MNLSITTDLLCAVVLSWVDHLHLVQIEQQIAGGPNVIATSWIQIVIAVELSKYFDGDG